MMKVAQEAIGLPGFLPAAETRPRDDNETISDASASALAHARERWKREEDERLARAKTEWATKSEKRLAISRIGAQRAESALEQLCRRLDKVEASLAARTFELAEARVATEQERVRWSQSPVAAQAQKAARDLQFERRAKIALRLARELSWTVLVVAAAILVTQRMFPVVTAAWRHETGSHSMIRPLLQQAGIATENMPHAVVVIPFASLRAQPSNQARVVASIPKGAKVGLLGRRGKWMLVRGTAGGGQEGWVPILALENATP